MARVLPFVIRIRRTGRVAILSVSTATLIAISALIAVPQEPAVARVLVSLGLFGVGALTLLAIKSSAEIASSQRVADAALEQQIEGARSDLAREIEAAGDRLGDMQTSLEAFADELSAVRLEASRIDNSSISLRAEVESALRERDAEVAAIEQRGSATNSRLGELRVELDQRSTRIETEVQSTRQDLHEDFDGLGRLVAARLARHRSALLETVAARDSGGHYPSRVLLLMTVSRSGSTRLFEMFRSHSRVYVEPLDFLWSGLGLRGRRYPAGLSDRESAGTVIVASPGQGVAIPSLKSKLAAIPDPSSGAVAIEKAHPMFFGFDPRSFFDNLNSFEEVHKLRVDVVYQVREPLDVMWSYAEYKARDPNWHGDLTIEEIPALVERSYGSLRELSSLRPGVVLDYTDLEPTNAKLLSLIPIVSGSEIVRAQDARWLAAAFERTDRSQLADTQFVGVRGARPESGPDDQWASLGHHLESSRRDHRLLLRSSGRGDASAQ